ncbi:DUF6966 domain-containing protein [Yoonia maritima]|uniref:DUF6966 domain-containing protein n=1 Tax=Yoonia maritima TaxID=1435347 RepID=UPI0037363A24
MSALQDTLHEHQASFWANNIQNIQVMAHNSDGACIDRFLRLFGRMGSLNDVILDAPDTTRERFQKQLARAYDLALKLK